MIWDRGLHSCLLGQRYSAFSSPSKLRLSILHSKPKAGNWLAEVKLYELSTETGSRFVLCSILCLSGCMCVSVCVWLCVSGQMHTQERNSTAASSSCSVSHPYIRALIEAKRLLVSRPSVQPQPLPPPSITSSCSSFHSSFTSLLCLPHPTAKLLTEAWLGARVSPVGCHRLTRHVTTH